MSIIPYMIILVLLIVIGWQYKSKRKLQSELHKIHDKLTHIVENKQTEKIFLQTNEQTVQQLLIQMNRLLSYNQSVMADYARTKDSMRKMLSNMSHDLKTPMTVILGYVERLKQKETLTKKEQEETVIRLHHKTLSVINLINQFFALVKIDSGDEEFPISRISINEICRKNILEFYHMLQSTSIKVEVDIPEENFYILGNEDALNRILHNLISNAIRYGSDGGVLGLTVRGNQEMVSIDIWDRGKGIKEVHLDRVFERLYTLDDARNPEFQGSGLGLSITKRLVETMDGEIHLYSKPFEKTVFTCTFKQMTY